MSTKESIKFIILEIKDFINCLITFIKHIPGYYKLYTWYEYDPMTYDFIVYHYQRVLDERTKRMSKPTYRWEDVISELDEYYEDIYKEEIEILEKEIERLEKKNENTLPLRGLRAQINPIDDACGVNKDGWILVEDRLPYIYEESNTSDVVLVQGYDKDIDYYWQAMGWYAAEPKQWFFAECKNTDKHIDWIDIIAWQPLPEDYKKEKM